MEKETSINLIEDVVSARAEEKSVDFPEDWVECDLGDVCDLYQPKTISSKNLIPNGKYVVYGANGIIGKYNKYNHKDEQLLMTCRGASCGNMHISQKYAWINGNAMVINPYRKDLLSLFYLKYYFSNRNVTSKAITGSAQPQITRTNLQSLNFPFPPLPIQRAIVQKIEALFSSLDSGIADLKKAQEQLTIYRQAVLKKAFEGGDKALIKDCCIKAEKIKKKNLNKENWIKYIDISSIDNKRNIIVGHKDFQWKNAPSRAQQIIKKNDILFSTVRTYLRNIAQITNETYDNEICSTGFTVLRANPEKIYHKYLFYFTLFNGFLDKLGELQTGTSYPAVRDKDVFQQLIPLPSISEQQVIVREIESRLSVCDAVENNIAESLEKAESLRQSILKKAFEGKLLTAAEIEQCKRETDYEPAEVLLERIRNEKNGK